MKPDLEEERKRIEHAGGQVIMGRVDGMLALSAAIGDKQYKNNSQLPPEKQMVTIVPQVMTQNLTKNCKFLIIACDGIWDCKTSQETVDFFTRHLWTDHKRPLNSLVGNHELAEAIGALFYENCPKTSEPMLGKDNMSCILIEFKKSHDKFIPVAHKPAGKPSGL